MFYLNTNFENGEKVYTNPTTGKRVGRLTRIRGSWVIDSPLTDQYPRWTSLEAADYYMLAVAAEDHERTTEAA